MSKDPDFSFIDYFPVLQNEVRSLGLNVTINEKEKTFDSNIRSAFLKGNTKEHILLFYPQDKIYNMIQNNEVIKIKSEVDVNPPDYAAFEHKYRLLPIPMKSSFMIWLLYLQVRYMLLFAVHGKNVLKAETFMIMFSIFNIMLL